jgi:hypothetical protein
MRAILLRRQIIATIFATVRDVGRQKARLLPAVQLQVAQFVMGVALQPARVSLR